MKFFRSTAEFSTVKRDKNLLKTYLLTYQIFFFFQKIFLCLKKIESPAYRVYPITNSETKLCFVKIRDISMIKGFADISNNFAKLKVERNKGIQRKCLKEVVNLSSIAKI